MQESIDKTSLKEVAKVISWSFGIAWKYERKLLVVNILSNILLAIFVFLQLVSFSNIVDEVILIKQSSLGITNNLILQITYLFLSFVIPSILRAIESSNEAAFRPKLRTHLQMMVMENFSKLDIATVESPDFQKKLAFANEWGIGSIINVITNFIDVVRNVTSLVSAAIILFLIKPIFILLAIIGSLPVYLSEEKWGRKLFRVYHERTDDSRVINDRTSFFQNPNKLIEVLIFNISSILTTEVRELRSIFDNRVINIGRKRSFAYFGSDFISLLGLLIAVVILIHGGIVGSIAIGSLILAFNSYRTFGSSTTQFFLSTTRVQEQIRYAVRWQEIFEIKPRVVSKIDALKPSWNKPPKIEYKNVSFSYPETDKLVLKDINLKLESGEKLALVGLNGAGKTTLIKLLARVYDPTSGEILIDGVNLKDIDIDYWRENLGILFQTFSNFNMTVRDAVSISRPNESFDNDRFEKAVEDSGVIDFIGEFPKKYNQLIWKGFQDGVELSQGQHQRMAVARILYRDALISVLDEPTSAIDAVAEEKIFEVLEKKMENRTVILISHRFSTVKNADQIAVIEHGELKELGSHKELMAKNGRYTELYNMQASRYLESE